jgi:hypothetical protein
MSLKRKKTRASCQANGARPAGLPGLSSARRADLGAAGRARRGGCGAVRGWLRRHTPARCWVGQAQTSPPAAPQLESHSWAGMRLRPARQDATRVQAASVADDGVAVALCDTGVGILRAADTTVHAHAHRLIQVWAGACGTGRGRRGKWGVAFACETHQGTLLPGARLQTAAPHPQATVLPQVWQSTDLAHHEQARTRMPPRRLRPSPTRTRLHTHTRVAGWAPGRERSPACPVSGRCRQYSPACMGEGMG